MDMEEVISDEKLVLHVQSGELEAFNTLYERYFHVVFTRVRYKIPEQDVEDLTQEIFISMMKSIKNFRGESRFSTWFRTLVNRKIADYYRYRKPNENFTDFDLDDDRLDDIKNNMGFNIVEYDNILLLKKALKQLPEKYLEILLLRFVDGLQFNEIAQINKQSLEATKSLFRRSIAALRKQSGFDDL